MAESCAADHAIFRLNGTLVEHYVIRHAYYIPKAKIIDFMMSPNYLQVLNRFRRDPT